MKSIWNVLGLVGVSVGAVLLAPLSVEAGLLVYSTAQEASFLDSLSPISWSLASGGAPGAYSNPLVYQDPSGPHGFRVTSTNYAIYVHQGIIHSFGTYDTLTITFPVPTTAFGARFGITTDGGELMGNLIAVTVGTTGGSSQTMTIDSLDRFRGFVATNGDTLSSVQLSRVDVDLGRYVALIPTISVGAVEAIPEPSTALLLIAGVVALGGLRGRGLRGGDAMVIRGLRELPYNSTRPKFGGFSGGVGLCQPGGQLADG
jgi:hypothetical protein